MTFPDFHTPVVILLLLSLNLAASPSAIAQERLSGRPDVEAFLDEVAAQHRLNRQDLAEQFSKISTDPKVIQLMQPVPPGEKSWRTWRTNHLDPIRIREGRRFLATHRTKLLGTCSGGGTAHRALQALLNP